MTLIHTHLPAERRAGSCQRCRTSGLALFDSVLCDDRQLEGELDILVTFAPGAGWGFLDRIRMEQKLAAILGRDVDLLTRRSAGQSHNRIRCQVLPAGEADPEVNVK